MDEIVSIRESGNLLEICPPKVDVLHPVLSYPHRIMQYGKRRRKEAMIVTNRRLYRVEAGKLYITSGMRERVFQAFRSFGVKYVYEDLRKRKELTPDYDNLVRCLPDLDFRGVQDKLLALLVGKDHGIFIAPTGYGKSFIARAVAALYPQANIILTGPSRALLGSTYRRILTVTPDVGRCGDGYCESRRVTISTLKSLLRAPVDKCDILLVDECHTAGAEEASRALALVRNPCKRFGFTASLYGRSDGGDMVAEALLGPVLYTVPYDEAARDGLVSKMKVAMVDLGPDTCSDQSSGYSSQVAKKRNTYWNNSMRNRAIAAAVGTLGTQLKLPDDPQVLVLVETLEHALYMKQALPDYELVYANADVRDLNDFGNSGMLPEGFVPLTDRRRKELLQQFEEGTLRKVIATGCWGTGVDFVQLDVLVYASGSPSEIQTTQWPGRNSRIREGKEFGLIVDCTDRFDNWGRRRALMRVRNYKKHGWEIIYPGVGEYLRGQMKHDGG